MQGRPESFAILRLYHFLARELPTYYPKRIFCSRRAGDWQPSLHSPQLNSLNGDTTTFCSIRRPENPDQAETISIHITSELCEQVSGKYQQNSPTCLLLSVRTSHTVDESNAPRNHPFLFLSLPAFQLNRVSRRLGRPCFLPRIRLRVLHHSPPFNSLELLVQRSAFHRNSPTPHCLALLRLLQLHSGLLSFIGETAH